MRFFSFWNKGLFLVGATLLAIAFFCGVSLFGQLGRASSLPSSLSPNSTLGQEFKFLLVESSE